MDLFGRKKKKAKEIQEKEKKIQEEKNFEDLSKLEPLELLKQILLQLSDEKHKENDGGLYYILVEEKEKQNSRFYIPKYDYDICASPWDEEDYEREIFEEDWVSNYNTALKLIDLGKEFHSSRRYNQALALIYNALQVNPESWELWYTIVKIFPHYYTKVKHVFIDKALEMNPESWEHSKLWYAKGSLAKHLVIIKKLEKIRKVNKNHEPPLDAFSISKYNESIECFDKALKIEPKLFDAIYNKIEVLLELKRFEEANTCHDKIIKMILNSWGTDLEYDQSDAKKIEEGIIKFTKPYNKHKFESDFYEHKITALWNLKKYKEIILYVDRFIDYDNMRYCKFQEEKKKALKMIKN